MKTENIVQYVLRLTVTLLLITGIVAAALAGVNAITKDAIAANQEKKTQDALALVLPDAQDLKRVDLTGDTGIVSEVYTDGEYFAVKVQPAGFDGAITMMVGIADGQVTGISVISHTETPGLGAVAAAQNAKGEAFRGQFVGQSGTLVIGDQVDAMSGATITSNAVVTGVNAALAYIASLN
jgi:electron transport complex protein RnfG